MINASILIIQDTFLKIVSGIKTQATSDQATSYKLQATSDQDTS